MTTNMNNNRLFFTMIEKPTVFILGAGASVPYGYLTGKGLREDICNNFEQRIVNLVNSDPQYSSYSVEPFSKDAIKLTETFFDSHTLSIDLFLARNPKFAEIGKQAIVTSILESERKSSFGEKMQDIFKSQDWYSYLFDKMTAEMSDPESYDKFYRNEVTFITFNYDRSLEHFLYESLRNSFSEAPTDKIQNQFNKIKIFHVYGVVDKLLWRDGSTKYREIPSLTTINVLSRNIKIVHERSIPGDDIKAMKDIIKEAKRIYFLGFGYARENLEILGLPAVLGGQQIFGTAFTFTNNEISEIKRRLSGPRSLNPWILDIDCLGLLRDWL